MISSGSTGAETFFLGTGWRRMARYLFRGLALLTAVLGLGIGGAVALLWATSDPAHGPHGGLLLGLPAGVLFLEGVLAGIATVWVSREWRGYVLVGPLLVGIVPILGWVDPKLVWWMGFVGLAPFAALARLLAIW